eukprot:scaffold57255_cov51-Phaeocystis_antarctica.AAC.2
MENSKANMTHGCLVNTNTLVSPSSTEALLIAPFAREQLHLLVPQRRPAVLRLAAACCAQLAADQGDALRVSALAESRVQARAHLAH